MNIILAIFTGGLCAWQWTHGNEGLTIFVVVTFIYTIGARQAKRYGY